MTDNEKLFAARRLMDLRNDKEKLLSERIGLIKRLATAAFSNPALVLESDYLKNKTIVIKEFVDGLLPLTDANNEEEERLAEALYGKAVTDTLNKRS